MISSNRIMIIIGIVTLAILTFYQIGRGYYVVLALLLLSLIIGIILSLKKKDRIALIALILLAILFAYSIYINMQGPRDILGIENYHNDSEYLSRNVTPDSVVLTAPRYIETNIRSYYHTMAILNGVEKGLYYYNASYIDNKSNTLCFIEEEKYLDIENEDTITISITLPCERHEHGIIYVVFGHKREIEAYIEIS